MTQEEAIRHGKEQLEMFSEGCEHYEFIIKMAIQALEQELCEDAISRDELLKAIDTWDRFGVDDTNSLFRLDNLSLPHYVAYMHYDDVVKCIKGMPSVKPQEPKTGHWIDLKEDNEMSDDDMWRYSCNMCHGQNSRKTLFCPNCGYPMKGA